MLEDLEEKKCENDGLDVHFGIAEVELMPSVNTPLYGEKIKKMTDATEIRGVLERRQNVMSN